MPNENASKTTPEARAAAPATVHVYNRSPATYTHGNVIVPPGGEADLPATVAENWRKVSQGLVTTSKDTQAKMNDAANALRLEQAKTTMLEAKIKAMEERHAALEKQANQRRSA